ncbi:hypothetical protein BOX15_Mlig014066g2, partial [Macrostomum lignano]
VLGPLSACRLPPQMSGACGLCSSTSRRRSQVSVQTVRINLRDEDSEAVLASSLEWLHNRVELLLSLAPGESPPQPEVLPRFTASRLSALSIPGVGGGGGGGGMLPGFRPMTERQVLQKRRRCMLLMLKLLKRLQSATRCLDSAIRLVSDEVFCRLLPLAICANFYDMPPACEIILAKTLANLSCHRAAYSMFSSDSFVCNLVDGWSESSCLALGLCGRKICANLSTYALLNALATDSSYRPHCIYQPDVYELAKPFLATPCIDVVFINGMLGSVFYTWKQGDCPASSASEAGRTAAVKSDSNSENDAPQVTECWPRDWLAEDMPRARVLALNMKIAAMKWRGCRQTGDSSGLLPRRANEAANQLLAAGVGNRMTAFVCHSFGGLIVKQMMQVLNSSEDRLRKRLLASIRGVVFIAVPHLGRSKAVNVSRIYWRPLRQLCLSEEARYVFDGSCNVLSHLHAWFVQYAQTRPDMRVLNIIELSRTPVAPGGIGLKVCPESWADKLVGAVLRLPTDHIQICKPPNRQHESYTAVLSFLESVAKYSRGWRPSLVFGSSGLGRALASIGSGGTRSVASEASEAESSADSSDVGGHSAGRLSVDWHRPVRHFEEELRLRYGVSSARALWTRAAWLRFGVSRRPRFYDLL